MAKQTRNFSISKAAPDQTALMFLSFCRALEKYCDAIGIERRNFSAARILHNAAANTISQMRSVTADDRRHMRTMEQHIPELISGLLSFPYPGGYLKNIEQMSDMSLAEVANRIGYTSHKR